MLTRRTVAASDMPTLRTPAEVKPPTFRGRQAFHTAIATRFRSEVDSALIFFHFSIFLSCSVRKKRMSSHQQDLPSTALFRGGLSFDCVAEWQLAADRDHKFASRAASAMNSRIFVRCREHLHYLRRLRQALSGRTVENCISALANLVDEYRKARCVARQSVFPSLRQQKAVE